MNVEYDVESDRYVDDEGKEPEDCKRKREVEESGRNMYDY